MRASTASMTAQILMTFHSVAWAGHLSNKGHSAKIKTFKGNTSNGGWGYPVVRANLARQDPQTSMMMFGL